VLAEYSCRMPFTPWSAPELSGLRLRTISRHIQSLVVEQTRQNNRLHNAEKSATTPRCVVNDLKRSMASLKLRIVRLRREALELVRSDEAMRKRFDLLILIPGIAAISAAQPRSQPTISRRRRTRSASAAGPANSNSSSAVAVTPVASHTGHEQEERHVSRGES